MSFFTQEQMQSNGTFEMGGEQLAPIPEGTSVLALCEEANNKEYEGATYINLKWRVNQPAEYANRVIFQKLHVYTPEKAERAKNMLSAIAINTGGRLYTAMQQANEHAPSDNSLLTMTNTPVVLKLGVWDLNNKKGNWVQAVSKYERKAAAAPAPVAPTPATDDFSSIPF